MAAYLAFYTYTPAGQGEPAVIDFSAANSTLPSSGSGTLASPWILAAGDTLEFDIQASSTITFSVTGLDSNMWTDISDTTFTSAATNTYTVASGSNLTDAIGVSGGGANAGSRYWRREVVEAAPTISSVAVTRDDEDTQPQVTISLTDSGSGGAGLYYGYAASGQAASTVSNWQTGSAFEDVTRGTNYNFYASRNQSSTLASAATSYTIPYKPPVNPGAANNANILTGETSHTGEVPDGASGTVYEFRSTSYTGTILQTSDGGGAVTVSGGAGTYYVTAYKTVASGGDGSTRVNVDSYTVTALSSQTYTITIDGEYNNSDGTSYFGTNVTVNVGSIVGDIESSTNPLEIRVGDTFIIKIVQGLDNATTTMTNINYMDFSASSTETISTTGTTFTMDNGVNGSITPQPGFTIDGATPPDQSRTLYFERKGGIDPVVISGYNLDGDLLPTDGVTLTFTSQGSGGTLEYAVGASVPATGWSTSPPSALARNDTHRVFASQARDLYGTYDFIDVVVPYLAPARNVSWDSSDRNDPYGTGTVSLDFTAPNDYDEYAIYEGATIRSAWQSGATDYNAVSTGVGVAAGSSRVFNLRCRRPTAKGGDGTTVYTDNPDSGTVTVKEYPQTPTASVTDDSTTVEQDQCTVTFVAANNTGASEYTFRRITDGTAFGAYPAYSTTNEATYAENGDRRAVNTAFDYQVKVKGANGLEAESSVLNARSLTKRYLDPKAFTVGNNDTEDYAYTVDNFIVTITNEDTDHSYRVLYGTGTPDTDGGTSTGANITLSGAEFPAAGTDMNYQVQVKRGTTSGGSNAWVTNTDTGGQFTKGRYPQTPTASVSDNSETVEQDQCTVTFVAANNTGASEYTFRRITDGTAFGAYPAYSTTNEVTYAENGDRRAVNTAFDYQVKVKGANGLEAESSVLNARSLTDRYLDPKAYAISTVSSDFEYSATDFDFTFTETDSDHTYGILYGTGASPSTVYGTELTGATSPQTINISGTAFPAAGNDMNYRARVKRGTASGGDGTTWTNNAIIITKGRKPGAPASITISDHDDFAGVYFNVNVTSGNSDGASNYYAQQYKTFDDTGTAIPSPSWSASATMTSQENTAAFNQFRGDNTTQYRVRGRGANLLYSDWTTSAGSHGNYLDPDPDVGFFSSTLTAGQASTDVAVLVTGVARPTETVAVRVNNGSTNLAEDTPGGTNTSVSITFDHGLDPGQTGTYEIFTKRALSTGGDGSTYLATDDTFTVYRPDTTVDAFSFTDVTNANLSGTYYTYAQINDISEAVTASRTSGDALFQVTNNTTQPAANDAGWTATAKSVSDGQYIHLKGTASASYSTDKSTVISVGDPATTSTWTITTKPTATAFDLGSKTDAAIDTDYESNIITVAGLSGTSAVSVSGGSYSKNSAAYTTTAGTVQNDDTLRVKGTSAANYDGTTVNVTLTVEGTSDIFDITTEVQPTVPTAISIPGDTTTASATVSMSCTASGGTGGTLRISEDDSTYDADNVASYTFTRGTAKTLYAKRFGININSPLFTRAAYTLGYIPPDSTINNPSATASQPDRENFVVSLSGCSANNRYLVYNSAKTQVLGFSDFTGTTGNITFADTSLAANSTGTYAIQVLRLVTLGGDGLVDDTGKTFTVTYTPSGNAPPSISASASNYSPSTSTSVTLTATATDSDGTISSVAWTQTGGTTTTPSTPTNSGNDWTSTITTPSSATTLEYYATATDDDGATTNSNTITINVGGGTVEEYGLLVKNSSGNDILRNTSTVSRIVSQSSTSLAWTSNNTTVTKDVTVTGMSSDGTWKVLMYTTYFDSNVGFSITETTNKFTITASIGANAVSSQSVTIYYYVLRI